eukprot:TRINITY_DN5655_c0_g1_i1.p1 TRINITY_DN5655_c0_g1~~TRINITY_DN5655_c0_g1_i1.p1  ORF type:complete len:214 (+),score=9.43 TRINITY_DN5655_c0_g1_i1:22-663(+)
MHKTTVIFIVLLSLAITPCLCGWFSSKEDSSISSWWPSAATSSWSWPSAQTSSWSKPTSWWSSKETSYWSSMKSTSWWSSKEPSYWSSVEPTSWWSSKPEPSSYNPFSWFSKEAVVTTSAAVGTPTVVQGVISALGFGAAGIAKGSVGATMMSNAAIAAGGGVAKGGIVSVLQSIGVLGLGTATIPVSAVGASAVGGYMYWDSISSWWNAESK